MLRLSKLTDYGTVLMTTLARHPREQRNAAELAKDTRIAAPTVRKLLKRLTHAGLVESSRGAQGGYRLARTPGEISVADVIAALEGPLGLTECALHDGLCGIEADCSLRGNWRIINRAIRRALTEVSLAEMTAPVAEMRLHVETAGTEPGTFVLERH
jgi:FeS assembly SUF system regulator